MKKIFFKILMMVFFTGSSWAVTVTQQGSGKMSWLTNGNSCWRACYNARNQAIQRINNIAASHCKAGYAITKAAKCITPARDPSFLDHEWGWPVCKCTDTCTASFQCNQTGQYPSFFGNVAAQWRQIRVFSAQQTKQVKQSYSSMQEIVDPESLYYALREYAKENDVLVDPLLKQIERGQVQFVKAPVLKTLMNELDHYGVKVHVRPRCSEISEREL